MRWRWAAAALLGLWLIVPGIAELPPLDRDEARFVQASKQMVESGDFVDIRFQEESRYKKPVGIYWLQSAVVSLSGQGVDAPIWLYRTVSAAGAVVAALALGWVALHLFGAPAGIVSAIVLVSIFGVAFEGRIAKTDAALLLFTVLAQGALARIYVGTTSDAPLPRFLPWLFWVATACGVLVKGPIAPLLSGLTVLALWALDRNARWLARLRPAGGMLLLALILAPWLAAITWRSGGAFWQESVGRDLLGKVASGQESHGAPPGYYALTFSLYFWPFGFAAITAVAQAWSRFRDDPGLRFCFCWYVPFWLLFELIPTKLPHYVLPAYPALALLLGWAATLPREEQQARPQTWLLWLRRLAGFGLAAVTLGLAAGIVAIPIWLGSGFFLAAFVAAALIVATGALAIPVQGRLPARRIWSAGIAAGAAYALLFAVVLPSLQPLWLSRRVAAEVQRHRLCADTVLASTPFHEPSLVFLVGTRTQLTDVNGAARHLLGRPDCALALVSAEQWPELGSLVAESGRQLTVLSTFAGLNYSNGDRLTLSLARVMP